MRSLRVLVAAVVLASVASLAVTSLLGPPPVVRAGSSSLLAIPTPPPTPVPPFGSPSPYPTALATPTQAASPPPVEAASVLLADMDTGQVLFARRPDERLPIASITKIMTALVVLERAGLSERVTVSAKAASQTGSVLGLRTGERISVRLLLYALLLQSSNDAAVALAEHVAGSVSRFVHAMNRTATRMGLRNTRFKSPNGLDDRGYSTARDIAAITRRALTFPHFARVVRTKTFDIPSPSGLRRHVQNRNALLWLYPRALGVKTGYTSAAGYCIVAAARRGGRRLMAIALGDPDSAFDEGAALLNFGFAGFKRRILVREGERLGRLRAGGRRLPVASGDTLLRLVPRHTAPRIRVRLRPLPSLSLPIVAGSTVGRGIVFAGGRVIGKVDAVAETSIPASAPASAEPSFEPGPLRHLEAVARVLSAFLRAVFGALPIVPE